MRALEMRTFLKLLVFLAIFSPVMPMIPKRSPATRVLKSMLGIFGFDFSSGVGSFVFVGNEVLYH